MSEVGRAPILMAGRVLLRVGPLLATALLLASVALAVDNGASSHLPTSEAGDSTHVWGPLYENADTSTFRTVPVTFQIEGFNSDSGLVLYAIYDREDGFPKDTTAVIAGGYSYVVNRTTAITFPLPPGERVAMIYFHDENANGELDMTNYLLFKIPKEGFGTSTKRQTTGRPKWKDAVFTVPDDSLRQDLEVYYL